MAEKISSFTDLEVWKLAHKFVLEVYRTTKIFPEDEKFGLTSQIRRASVSIVSNIVEGFSRQGKSEKTQFYFIAKSSLVEVQSQLLIARDIGYLSKNEFDQLAGLAISTHKLLNGLISSVRSWQNTNSQKLNTNQEQSS